MLHVGLQHANQPPKPPSFFKKSGVVLLPLVAKRIIFYKSTQPYSRKRALHFRHRRKASHCEAMLHAGKYSRCFTLVCNTQTNTPSPLLFQEKRNSIRTIRTIRTIQTVAFLYRPLVSVVIYNFSIVLTVANHTKRCYIVTFIVCQQTKGGFQ